MPILLNQFFFVHVLGACFKSLGSYVLLIFWDRKLWRITNAFRGAHIQQYIIFIFYLRCIIGLIRIHQIELSFLIKKYFETLVLNLQFFYFFLQSFHFFILYFGVKTPGLSYSFKFLDIIVLFHQKFQSINLLLLIQISLFFEL